MIFGASRAPLLGKSLKSISTFTIRSPFVVFNRTDVDYALKIVIKQKVRASPNEHQEVVTIKPGEGYPLDHRELTYAKFYVAHQADYQNDQNRCWSSSFKLGETLFKNRDISKTKFFKFHQGKFSMLFVEPGEFPVSWDISIKVPVIVRNCLPFDLLISSKKVLDFSLAKTHVEVIDSESFGQQSEASDSRRP